MFYKINVFINKLNYKILLKSLVLLSYRVFFGLIFLTKSRKLLFYPLNYGTKIKRHENKKSVVTEELLADLTINRAY